METKRYLLSKEHYKLLLEKAVDWDKSAAGKTTKGLGTLMSWITGKIKKGLNNRKLNTLVLMWGTEYVKALEAMDKNLEVKQEIDNSEIDGNDTEEANNNQTDDSFKITDENKKSIIDTLNKESIYYTNMQKFITTMNTWTIPNDNIYNTLKKQITVLEKTDILNKVLVLLNDQKYLKIDSDFDTISGFIDNIQNLALKDFLVDYKINTGTDINVHKANLKKLISDTIAKFTTINNAYKAAIAFVNGSKPDETKTNATKSDELKVGNEYDYTNKKGIKTVVKLLSLDHQVGPGPDGKFFTNDDVEGETLADDTALVIGKDPNKPYIVLKKNLKPKGTTLVATNASYKSINERNIERKLPTNIEDLIPKDDLLILSQQPDILVKSFPKINLYRLNGLLYDANHIIVNAKKSKDADKIFNKEEDGDVDLKKTWDIGINNINDYFQKVIDTKKVMAALKPETLKPEDKKQIENINATIDAAKNMGFDEAMDPKNAKFNPKNLYSFNLSIRGTNSRTDKFIITSPVANYIETINGVKFYWHKIFGEYDYNTKTRTTERKNLFDGITKNQKMVEYFSKPGETYYIVLSKQSVSAAFSPAFFYSAKGNIFYNNKIQPFNDIKNEITTNFQNTKDADKFKNWKLVGNGFDVKINARYSIDSNDIDKYPGITLNDINKDLNIDVAKKSHDELIKLLNIKIK